jgi:hypothetical protein
LKTLRPFDIFISYASEDALVATALREELAKHGLRVWMDVSKILVGDDFKSEIDLGLDSTTFAIALLGRSYFFKKWTKYELARLSDNMDRILPIIHRITMADVSRLWPEGAGLRALDTSEGLDRVCQEIAYKVRKATTET